MVLYFLTDEYGENYERKCEFKLEYINCLKTKYTEAVVYPFDRINSLIEKY